MKNAPSVLHVVETLERGGLERVVCDLAAEQQRRGWSVAVFCLFHGGPLAPELTARGIPVLEGRKQRGFDLGCLRRLRAAVRSQGARVVHTHDTVASYYAAVAELSSLGWLPLVNTLHNMGTGAGFSRLKRLYALSVRRTGRVAMVSPQVADRFVDMGVVPRHKAAVVMNGIPVERYRTANDESRRRARALLKLDDAAWVVGSVGRLVPVKNHALLLHSLAPRLKADPSGRILLIGGGALEASLRTLAESLEIGSQVLLAGERQDIAELLPAFDVFAMPSLSEGHSIALLEATATGLAIVATRVGGNPEIIQDGETGLLVPSADGPALAGAIGGLLEEPAQRRRLGRNAQDWVRSHVSVQAMADRYEALYEAAGMRRRAS